MRLFSFILCFFASLSAVSATFIAAVLVPVLVSIMLVSITFVSITSTHAAPNPTISRLMNEPLSMLDYGLWRTEIELKRYFIGLNNMYIAARYDWQKDQIAIEILLNEIPSHLQELKEKDRCISVMNSVKEYYAVDVNTKKKNTLFGKSFTHNGYAGTDIPQDELFKKLDSMTRVYVSIIKNQKSKINSNKIDYTNFIVCESALKDAKTVIQ